MDQPPKTVGTPLPGQGAQPPTQPVTPPAAPVQPAKPTQSDMISRDEAQKLIEAAANAAEDRAFKRSQALITKSNERIRAEVTRLETIATKAGLPPFTPEQKAKVTEQVTDQVLTESAPPAEPGQAPQGEALDPVTTIALGMMKEAGIEINDQDPEFKTLEDEHDPYKFIQLTAKAINDKRARTSSAQAAQIQSAVHNPGTGTEGLPPSDIRPGQGHELLTEYFKEKSVE